MAVIKRQKEYENFFKNKTIMHSFLFLVDIPSLYISAPIKTPALYNTFKEYTKTFIDGKDNFNIDANFVKSVSVPEFSFSKNNVKHGPTSKSAAVLDFDGYEIKLDLEEDNKGSVRKFIDHCKSRNIKNDGLFWPPNFAEIPGMTIKVLNTQLSKGGTPVMIFEYTKLLFLAASEVTLDYGTSESIKYSITFSASGMTTEYP